MAQAMFRPRLRNHKVLARTAGGTDLSGMESGDEGGFKGVPLETIISWLSRATVCSVGSGDGFL